MYTFHFLFLYIIIHIKNIILKMKSIYNVLEAKASEKGRKKKPSGLYKSQSQARKVMNTYLDSDIYDFSDKGTKREDTYYDRKYWGFIMDKEGNIYDVVASSVQGDAGRIVGGSTTYYVDIKYSDELTISLSDYTAVFSNGDGYLLISNIEAGHYLEDYLAMHEYDIKNPDNDIIKNLISSGDKDAVSFDKVKNDKKKMKEAEFDSRYINLTHLNTEFVVEDGKVKYSIKDEKLKSLEPVFIEFIEKALDVMFTNVSLSDLGHLAGYLTFPNANKYDKYVAYDIKKKNLVYILKDNKGKRKVSEEPVEYSMSDSFNVWPRETSKEFKEWLLKAYDIFTKEKRHEHAEWVKNRTERILQQEYWRITKKEAKSRAEAEWEGILNSKHPGKEYISINSAYIALANSKIKPKAKVKAETPDTTPNDLPSVEDNLDNKPKETGEQPELPKGSEEAIEKMKKWHNGERGFNVKAASPAKLKLNYKICKHLGYEEEMKKIEDAAKEKGVVLESKFSLSEYVEIIIDK